MHTAIALCISCVLTTFNKDNDDEEDKKKTILINKSQLLY